PPWVECLGSVDTALCLAEPDTLCLPVTILGTDVQVAISPIGYYEDGFVCIPVLEPGEFEINVTAYNDYDTVVCVTSLVVTGGVAPEVIMPDDTTLHLCEAGEVCFDAVVRDTDFDIVSIDVSYGTYNPETDQICFAADVDGQYAIILTVTDDCGNVVEDTTIVDVTINKPPDVILGDDFSALVCEGDEVCVYIGWELDGTWMLMKPNFGVFNAANHEICFTPDTAGIYELIVKLTDKCGQTDVDTAYIDVQVNSAPTISNLQDTSVYLCFPTQICVPVDIADIDDNLASVSVSRGTYADGQICILPYNQGGYEIVVTAVDECGLQAVDTVVITVKTDQGISLECPEDTTIFLCEPDTVCFPIGGIPEGAEVSVSGIATYWDAAAQAICFYSDCCLENTIGVTVTTACGSYSCDFRVSIQTNSPPLVVIATDTSIVQCELTDICLPVGINDIDGNISSVETNFGTYDSYRRRVCFTPDTAGTYTVVVTAIDSCGGDRVDTALVTVALNSAPVITYEAVDTVFQQCEPEVICLPIEISDIDGNIASITVTGGEYDAENRQVCLLPDGLGTFCMEVVATDICGLLDSRTICVVVDSGNYVDIVCPDGDLPEVVLCEAGEICHDLLISGNGTFDVSVYFGTWSDNSLCFTADTSGLYTITVIAEADCVSDTCEIVVPVTILEPLAVACPPNDNVFLCAPDTLCYDFSYAPASADVQVSDPAYLHEGQICVPVPAEGEQIITVTVSNQCGIDSCSFSVVADFNDAPTVVAGDDVTLVECALSEICVPLTVTDNNDNITSLTTTLGELDGDSLVCLTPDAYGTYQIIVTVTDDCGLTDVDTVVISISEGEYASIECPDGTQYASICGPDTVCILAAVTPPTAEVTVLPAGTYNPETGEVCVFASAGGTRAITVIAASQCGSDTCTFNLAVDFGIPPAIACPDTFDTLLCLVEPVTLCIPVEIVGSGVSVNVNPAGTWEAGMLCVPISGAGEHTFDIIAHGTCGADTCSTTFDVTADEMPQLFLPEMLAFERCPDDTDQICIDGIFGTDAESDVVITQICGPGEFTSATGDSGAVCFVPTAFGEVAFCFEITDGCHTLIDTMVVDIQLKDDCDVCVRMTIDGGECTPVGLRHVVKVNIETNDAIGGFDILLAYDASALSFQNAWLDDGAADAWEYFTWNLNDDACGGACPSGIVRFVGIADHNNGAAHPPESAYTPEGTLIFMEYQIANDQNLGGQFVPINFFWLDCSDNSFSDTTGTVLFIDSRIYNVEHLLLWDEFDEDNFPETARLQNVGAPDSCIIPDQKTEPLRCVEFVNGGICIIHPDSIDDRGDINLNGIAYEIADVVVFTNYFIRGLSAFTLSVPGQIAATDVNADGLTLTVSDLSLLIRVVVGDANPVPKLRPYDEPANVSSLLSAGDMKVTTETVSDLGIGYFVYDLAPGVTVGEPELGDDAGALDMMWSIEDNQLKVLLYDLGTGRVASGRHELFTVPVTGEGGITLSQVELVDYQGQPYKTQANGAVLPDRFTLNQNYPNPFNPSTTISFGLPQSASWNLRVYNITGCLVKSFKGDSEGGVVELEWDGTNEAGEMTASGVYFYRLDAGTFSDTKKMVLLK
ncbi:MAG: T9SS type A sorting domain-containing protein, partial [candidate division Zixibacteria bacterium]|nr:T9SS type A sorting domain-containing protein [candidate division Zixibacteria bacterium]